MPAVAVLAIAPLASCGTVSSAHLVVNQTADGASSDHRSHVAPGTLVGITISIANTGSGPARGVTVADVLPAGFHYYELTTMGGDSIRTQIDDPGALGGPRWGTWTIPAGSSGKESTLVISFKAQAPLKPGDYQNTVNVLTAAATSIEAGPPAVVTVDPRPSITVTTAATSSTAVSGGAVTYVVSVSNVGSAVAHGIAVSISLPPGFLYQTTSGVDGNGSRVQSIDPPSSSLLPLWAAWDLPAMQNGAAGLLRITFQARVLPAVAAGLYTVTTGLTGGQDVPAQTIGNAAPVAVGKGTTVPVTTRVAAQSAFAPQNGRVTYVITVENDSTDAAGNVTITDTLPPGLTYAATSSISVNGRATASRLSPATGTGTPQWGPFAIPAGGYAGSTLVIVFTAQVSGSAPLGAHADVVSGTSSNAQITGGSDQTPVIVTAG